MYWWRMAGFSGNALTGITINPRKTIQKNGKKMVFFLLVERGLSKNNTGDIRDISQKEEL